MLVGQISSLGRSQLTLPPGGPVCGYSKRLMDILDKVISALDELCTTSVPLHEVTTEDF